MLVEYCYDYDKRRDFIENHKPKSEQPLRLKLFQKVKGKLPDAWVDESKTRVGYEINFNRYFYQYTPPRPLEEIETDLKRIEGEIADMLAEVTECAPGRRRRNSK